MIPLSLEQIAKAINAQSHDLPEHLSAGGVSVDSRSIARGDLFFAICGERFDGHEFTGRALQKGAVACVCAREHGVGAAGNRGPFLFVDDTATALARLAAYYRSNVMAPSTQVVAVTGSNGKTTTKRMIDHILGKTLQGRASPKSFNNHIGVPLTLLAVEADDRYVIAEIGSNAPGEVATLGALVRPDVAVITSIGEAHLERLGDLHGVAAEKTSLLDSLQPSGLAVVNVDQHEIRPFLERRMNGRLLTYGQVPGVRLPGTVVRSDLSGTTFELEERYRIRLTFPGPHHVANATAAFAVGRWFGIDPVEIARQLETFEPGEGRAKVYTDNGVTVVDDSYNANPTSMNAAIETMRSVGGEAARRVFVMGDMLELGRCTDAFHERVVRNVMEAGIEVLVTVGEQTGKAVRAVGQAKAFPCCISCENTDTATEALVNLVSRGDVVWIKGSRAMQLDRVVDSLRALKIECLKVEGLKVKGRKVPCHPLPTGWCENPFSHSSRLVGTRIPTRGLLKPMERSPDGHRDC